MATDLAFTASVQTQKTLQVVEFLQHSAVAIYRDRDAGSSAKSSVFPVRCQDCPLSLFYSTKPVTVIQRFSVFKFGTCCRIGRAKCLPP